MSLYRIFCSNKENTMGYAEKLSYYPFIIDNDVYYTDYSKRNWCATYDFSKGHFVLDIDIINEFIPGKVYKVRPGTGKPLTLADIGKKAGVPA